MKRRFLKQTSALLFTALALTLTACSKKEEAAPAAAAAAKTEPLKIAFAYVGPVGDGGWTFAHEIGRAHV